MRTHVVVAVAVACGIALCGATGTRADAQDAPRATGRGRINITTYDSVARARLDGATIRIMSVLDTTQVRAVVADAQGRARIDSVPEGPWVVQAHHPTLDARGVGALVAPIRVTSSRTTTARLTVPSAGALAARVCGTAAPGTGYLFGTVRRALGTSRDSSVPVAAQLTAQWLDMRVDTGAAGARIVREVITSDVPVGDDGRYVVCGVPNDATVRVQATGASGVTGVATVQVPTVPIIALQLLLGRADTTVAPREVADSTARDSADIDATLTGNGAVRGVVRGAEGRAVAGAQVTLSGTGLVVRTDSAGRFFLQGTPTGTWTLDVRAIGYAPTLLATSVYPRDTVMRNVTIARATLMDTVRVRARAVAATALGRNLLAFEERRRASFGRFFGPEDLEVMRLFRFTDLLLRIPGVRLELGGRDRVITMRGTRGRCIPTVLVDRMRMPGTEALDQFLPPDWVAAVEVYQAGSGPAEFQDIFSGCGTIVVWTGARR